MLTGDKKESENLKDKSDVLIQNRDISELKGMFAPKIHDSVENFKIAALGILEHIKAEQYILDEGALISVIQNALQEAIVDIQIKNL